MSTIISFANQKGGVGKTTLCTTFASKFSRQAIVRLGELKDVDYLFTDDVPKQIADYLENSNTKLVICK